jgi:hypothetical protein
MLTFAAEHGITADIELLPSARVEEGLTRLDSVSASARLGRARRIRPHRQGAAAPTAG